MPHESLTGTFPELGTSELCVFLNDFGECQVRFVLHNLTNSVERAKYELVDVAITEELYVVTEKVTKSDPYLRSNGILVRDIQRPTKGGNPKEDNLEHFAKQIRPGISTINQQ